MHSCVAVLLRSAKALFASLCAGLVLANVSDAATISGRVTAADGVTPLQSVEVYAYNWDVEWEYWGWMSCSYTDSNGDYQISELPTGTYRVRFRDYSGQYIGEIYNGFQGTQPYQGGTDIPIADESASVTGIDASLELGSAISGRVTAGDGVTPLWDVLAYAYRWNGSGWNQVNYAWTDASGNYRVGGLLAGTYRIRFSDYTGQYIDETYDDFQGVDPYYDGTDIVVPSGATVDGIDASLAQTSHIAGTVTAPDGVTPLAGISVTAYRWVEYAGDSYGSAGYWSWEQESSTDASGNYDISGLFPGTYRVKFYDSSYTYVTQVFAGAENLDDGTDVVVPPETTVGGIGVSMVLGGRIAGRVTASDDTTPLEGIGVTIYGWSDGTGDSFGSVGWKYDREGETDASGDYSIGGLSAGNYRIRFRDWNDVYAPEFYDNALDVDSATDIVVPAQTVVDGIDASLVAASHVTGNVTGPDGQTPLENVQVALYKWHEGFYASYADAVDWEWLGDTPTDANGNYDIGGLPAGSYRIGFRTWNQPYFPEFYDNAPDIDSAADVVVSASATVGGIDASLGTGSSIAGRVTGPDGQTPLGEIDVAVYRWREGYGDSSGFWSQEAWGTTDANGDYAVDRLDAGTYRLEFGDPYGAYAPEAYDDALDLDSGTDVVVPFSTAITGIDASLALYASISGTVRGNGAPLCGARIKAFHEQRGLIGQGVTDAQGRCVLTRLLPGTYRVKAEADGFADAWWIDADNPSNAVPHLLKSGGEAAFEFDLVPGQSPALVQVTSDPPGAAIYLDYQPTGEVTPAVIDVGEIGRWDSAGTPLASHVVTLKRTGSPQPVPRTITPMEAETTVEHFDLTGEATGAVRVETEPAGAEVFVDYADAPVGITPILVENLAPGSHTILLRKEGYLRPRPVTAQVLSGESLSESSRPNSFAIAGTPQGWHADDDCWQVDLPFAFPFYGVNRTRVVVGSNGTLAFDGDFSPWGYNVYSLKYRPMIAVMGDDLVTTTPGDIAILASSDAFTVRWSGQYYGGSGDVDFSATLHSDGRIELKYGEGNANGGVIGVSAGDEQRFAFSSRSLAGSLALADDIVYEPFTTSEPTIVQIPLRPSSDEPQIAVDVKSPLVPDMAVYIDYLPTEHVTDAVVFGLDPATHSGSYLGENWRTASHTILLRKPGVRPFAPRVVGDAFDVVQPLSAEPWMCAISLPEALDTEGSAHPPAWSTGPLSTPWSAVAEVDGNGEDAAASGAIGDGGASWLVMSVTNSGVLAFNWRASCQPRYDYLLLIVDGRVEGRLSGETGWSTKQVVVEGEGPHEIVWNYIKDGSVSGGEDRVWVDQVVWTPNPALTLAEALDATNLVWTTFGDMPWQPLYSPSLDGEDAARSGAVGDYGISALQTTVVGPGLVQFAWRASCESYGDWFDFLVDGALVDTLSGEFGWEDAVFEVGPGEHTLIWEYWKNESGSMGDDLGLLDCVLWTPYGGSATQTATTPVPVPYVWLDGYPSLLASAGGDYEAAAWTQTGKRDGGGNAMVAWQDYVAGTCPTNPASRFLCRLDMAGESPTLVWDPDLGNERVYTIWGRPDLAQGEWTTPTNAASRFFRIQVSLP